MNTQQEYMTKNRQVAERLGWTMVQNHWPDAPQDMPNSVWGRVPNGTTYKNVPDYCGDIEAAMGLLDGRTERILFLREEGLWRCEFLVGGLGRFGTTSGEAESHTLCLALVEAFLAATEKKVVAGMSHKE